MFALNSLCSQLLFCTVRVFTKTYNGKTGSGTAYFFHLKLDDNQFVPILVTNKHVIENANQGEFLVHEAMTDSNKKLVPSEKSCNIIFEKDFHKEWYFHPNKNVDLCAMLFQPLRLKAEQQEKKLYYTPLDEALIPNEEMFRELSAYEEVTMVGYPIGLWDEIKNLPLIRKGGTALHPIANFQNQPVGILDIAAFPGSSGSPVFIINEGSYNTSNGIHIGSRLIFIGTQYAAPYYTSEGKIEIREIPTALAPIITTQNFIHLGYYIKSSEILTLKAHIFNSLSLSPMEAKHTEV